jgi:hypothetical protein
MYVEVFVQGSDGTVPATAQIVGARRPGRGKLRDKTYAYSMERGWREEDTEPGDPTLFMT